MPDFADQFRENLYILYNSRNTAHLNLPEVENSCTIPKLLSLLMLLPIYRLTYVLSWAHGC